MTEKELQEKILAYRILDTRLNSLLKNREMVISKILEIESTMSSLKELKKNDSVIFTLGSETYAFGKLTDRSVITEVGANVAIEKSIEHALDTLNKRKENLENMLKSIEKDVNEVSSALEQLSIEIQEATKQKS